MNTPLSDPFAGTARGARPGAGRAARVFDAGLAAIPAQGRVLGVWGAWGTVGLAAHDREPRTRGSRARYSGSRATKNLHACTLLTNPVGGVPSRVRRIRRFPTPHTHPLRGPAPGLPPGRRQTRVLPSWHLGAPLALCPRKDRKGAYSHTHSAGFPGAHAGSDGCTVFTREIRPIKRWGLCTGAAA